jgi:uncharacterized protein (TIGR02231 family)
MSPLVLLFLSASPVDSVVVYPDRAQVVRVSEVPCGPKVLASFTGITPAAAGDSFRAHLEGGKVEGVRSEERPLIERFGPEEKALSATLKKLSAERLQLSHTLERVHAKAEAARAYGQVAAEMTAREMADHPDPKGWASAFDAVLSTQLEGTKAEVALAAKVRELDQRLEAARRRLGEIDETGKRSEWIVEVLVSCPPGRTAKVELSYLVGGASWSPAYEARADEGGGGTVELSTWATIRQTTGEAWKGATLLLSTAVPAQNATPPELRKLMVDADRHLPEKKVLVRRQEYVAHARSESGSGPAPGGGLEARAQGLSVQLAVPERATVGGDGTPARLFVGRTPMKARFSFRTVPRLAPDVFRVAELANQAPFPLLPGPLDAFGTSGFIARYPLRERVPEGGAFTLTFGVEDGLKVKRVALEELKRQTGLFNSKVRFSYGYRFEVANYEKAPREVELWEGLPVSELSDVTVSVGEKTSSGYQLNPADGIAKWKVKLAAQGKQDIELAYQVDVPSTYETGTN